MDAWPSADDLQLDESQLKAVQLGLTSEFALIQGPPGTGKTYIGLKVVKVLLHNKHEWMTGIEDDEDAVNRPILTGRSRARKVTDHPILVVCFTNHALDQFLEGIHEFHPKGIVRVGGRSQSEVMKDCNLGEIRHKQRKEKTGSREVRQSFFDINNELEHIARLMKTASENLQKCMKNVIQEAEFLTNGCMTTVQFNSLNTNPSTGVRNNTSLMCVWLGVSSYDPFEENVYGNPVAVFPFNSTSIYENLVYPDHKAQFKFGDVIIAPGINDFPGGSMELLGSHDSFIWIPNEVNSPLDTSRSMTILFFVFPTSSEGGPIVCFQSPQGIIGIMISQDGEFDGKGILTAVFNSRNCCIEVKALRAPVLNINQWNYVAASYNYDTGVYRLWHDGVMVQEDQIRVPGGMEIASQFPVYIGSALHCYMPFKGRICNLHIFPQSIGRELILSIGGIQDEDFPSKVDMDDKVEENGIDIPMTDFQGNDDDTADKAEEKDVQADDADTDGIQGVDILYEASAEQDRRILDVDRDVTYFTEGKSDREPVLIADPVPPHHPFLPWETQHGRNRYLEKINKTIEKELGCSDMMSSDEASQVTDVWSMSEKDRWRLYRFWVDQLCRGYLNTMERHQESFKESTERLKEVKSMEDLAILKNATVIGMTTTGASKYRDLIQAIRPRITIVEEAAEVLESHIVTSLTPRCQHLILIGDHQQLRPKPTDYELEKKYNLDMSLFERMVKNGMRLERLSAQHRMRPEIAEMMVHIYDNLQNHESVLNYEHIMGVNSNIFFIEHNELEDNVVEGRSRSNVHEAKYLTALCRYFILQGYKRNQITILTMYTGQLLQFKKEMSSEFFKGVRVSSVDNFQGEENDIILLSLVRSNEEGKIGFLSISNRVCVALSRAKKGFYCIGNIKLVCRKEELWRKIISDMRERGKLDSHLTLTCQNHPKNIIQASKAEHFREAPEGGCMEPCKARLDCGHVCRLLCHPIDSNHEEYKCRQKCTKLMECGEHPCPKKCWEECGECLVLVSKELSCGHVVTTECYRNPETIKCFELVSKEVPNCHHQQNIPCHMDPIKFECKAACSKKLPCSHPCTKMCSEKCDEKCLITVSKTWSCGHVHKVPCPVDPEKDKCRKLVYKEIPGCQHLQKVRCHLDPKEFRCKAPCSRKLPCLHECHKLCSECDDKCTVKVPKKWSCGHVSTVECHVDPDKTKCPYPCRELLKCNHQCQGTCSDCFQGRIHQQCQVAKCGRSLFCGHPCKEACARNCPPCKSKCENRCIHKNCQNECGEFCQPCMMPCSWACEHYKCKQLCGQPCDRPRCNYPCMKKLPCGHPCIGMCGEPCPRKCRVCNKDELTKMKTFGHEEDPDARFVELQDCHHMIEVQAMDRYMDGTDDASAVQFKRCPLCQTPIRTDPRYGTVIKKILNDFEKVKAKCKAIDSARNLQQESKRLVQKMADKNIPNNFWKGKSGIQDVLIDAEGLTSDQLSMYENKINYMSFLNKIIESARKVTQALKTTQAKPLGEHDEMKSIPTLGVAYLALKERIIQQKLMFSDQEKEEIKEELFRVYLLVLYRFLVYQIERKNVRLDHSDECKLEKIGKELESVKRIDKEDQERYEKKIEKIAKFHRKLNVSELPLIKQEKDMSLKEMRKAQGHYFKCPNGHIYEKVSEESRCEECSIPNSSQKAKGIQNSKAKKGPTEKAKGMNGATGKTKGSGGAAGNAKGGEEATANVKKGRKTTGNAKGGGAATGKTNAGGATAKEKERRVATGKAKEGGRATANAAEGRGALGSAKGDAGATGKSKGRTGSTSKTKRGEDAAGNVKGGGRVTANAAGGRGALGSAKGEAGATGKSKGRTGSTSKTKRGEGAADNVNGGGRATANSTGRNGTTGKTKGGGEATGNAKEGGATGK